MKKIPINDQIAYSISNLVDDSQVGRRDPSHYEIETLINECALSKYDPNQIGKGPVGKMKRIRHVLIGSLEEETEKAEAFAYGIISLIRSSGGFRELSPNFIGWENIHNLQTVLKDEGILLGDDGTLSYKILDDLSNSEKTDVLYSYIKRARKGSEDAALIVGTSKDLIEAVSAHVIF